MPLATDAPTLAYAPRGRDGVAWSQVVSPAFIDRVDAMCRDLGCQTNDVMAAMAFETSETFSPSIRNSMSGATGLIQFMSDTVSQLGTSSDALAAMSPEDQLAFVEAYLQPFSGHLHTTGDVYMAILWPRGVGKADDFPLFVDGSPQYAQNYYLDLDGDGAITKIEASSLVAGKLQKGLSPEYSGPVVAGSSIAVGTRS